MGSLLSHRANEELRVRCLTQNTVELPGLGWGRCVWQLTGSIIWTVIWFVFCLDLSFHNFGGKGKRLNSMYFLSRLLSEQPDGGGWDATHLSSQMGEVRKEVTTRTEALLLLKWLRLGEYWPGSWDTKVPIWRQLSEWPHVVTSLSVPQLLHISKEEVVIHQWVSKLLIL